MKKSLKVESIEWLKAIAVGLIIFIIVRTYLFSNYVVQGESMLPTLHEGNKLIVNKISYRISDINRFDVVVFHASKQEDYVKRVVGLPGDKIEYRDDMLYINGEQFEELYLGEIKESNLSRKITGDFTLQEITGEHIVPEGKLFVLGDNRLGSWDSRHFGFVPIDEVVGKVNLRYWPLKDIAISF